MAQNLKVNTIFLRLMAIDDYQHLYGKNVHIVTTARISDHDTPARHSISDVVMGKIIRESETLLFLDDYTAVNFGRHGNDVTYAEGTVTKAHIVRIGVVK